MSKHFLVSSKDKVQLRIIIFFVTEIKIKLVLGDIWAYKCTEVSSLQAKDRRFYVRSDVEEQKSDAIAAKPTDADISRYVFKLFSVLKLTS